MWFLNDICILEYSNGRDVGEYGWKSERAGLGMVLALDAVLSRSDSFWPLGWFLL